MIDDSTPLRFGLSLTSYRSPVLHSLSHVNCHFSSYKKKKANTPLPPYIASLIFPVICLKKKMKEKKCPHRKGVGGRWANVSRQRSATHTRVILEFHTAPRKLLPTTHRGTGSSPTCFHNPRQETEKKRLRLTLQNESSVLTFPQLLRHFMSFFSLIPPQSRFDPLYVT